MRPTNLIDRLKDLLIGNSGQVAKQKPDAAFPQDAVARTAGDARELIAHLEEQGASAVMAGCVQVVGLDRIKSRIGSNHADLTDQLQQIAGETLDTFLGDADVYRPIGDDAFQICFETSDQSFAEAQIARISAAIEARLAAEVADARGNLAVEGFAAAVPSERLGDTSDPMSALYDSLLEIRKSVGSSAARRHSIPALRSAGVRFQPLWSNRDFGRTKNRCLLDTFAGDAAAKHLEEIEDPYDLVEALANLDCVLFAKSIEGLHHALGDLKRASIVIPVHFQTLATRQQEYLDLAQTMPLQYRRFVLLDLIGVPTAASQMELLGALQSSRSITDRVILQLSPSDYRFDPKLKKLVWGVSIILGELDSSDPRINRELSRFALAAAEDGLYSFAYGASTISKAEAVVEAGFDYIGGTAIHGTVPTPRPQSRFTPLFGDPPPRASALEGNAGLRAHPRFAPLDPNTTITLPNGQQHSCRIPNVSASGAVVLTRTHLEIGAYLVVGSIPAQIVRLTRRGFAVRFLEVQQPSVLEVALHAPLADRKLLESLKALGSAA
ncbi:MAG TPA: hypothetical protein VGN80_12080 [Devosiaceae bacterium]|nr:hypothetical protein [Devosiaceae bacterium]